MEFDYINHINKCLYSSNINNDNLIFFILIEQISILNICFFSFDDFLKYGPSNISFIDMLHLLKW